MPEFTIYNLQVGKKQLPEVAFHFHMCSRTQKVNVKVSWNQCFFILSIVVPIYDLSTVIPGRN